MLVLDFFFLLELEAFSGTHISHYTTAHQIFLKHPLILFAIAKQTFVQISASFAHFNMCQSDSIQNCLSKCLERLIVLYAYNRTRKSLRGHCHFHFYLHFTLDNKQHVYTFMSFHHKYFHYTLTKRWDFITHKYYYMIFYQVHEVIHVDNKVY